MGLCRKVELVICDISDIAPVEFYFEGFGGAIERGAEDDGQEDSG